jgi:plasmid stabilization system protein ParE
MLDVLIAQGAEDDYTDSLRWYAERSLRAANGFEAEFLKALESIAISPDAHPLCDHQHRYYMLKRYPFQVIYRNLETGQVLIVAVAHASRQPGYWAQR